MSPWVEIVAGYFAVSQEALFENALETSRNICGEALKKLRISMGLSQSQLAIRCQLAGWDVDRKLLSKIETGLREIADYEIRILSSVLDVSPNSFFSMTEDELRYSFRIVSDDMH